MFKCKCICLSWWLGFYRSKDGFFRWKVIVWPLKKYLITRLLSVLQCKTVLLSITVFLSTKGSLKVAACRCWMWTLNPSVLVDGFDSDAKENLCPVVKMCCLLSSRRHKRIAFVQVQHSNSTGKYLNISRHFTPAFLVVVRGWGMDSRAVSDWP